MYTFIDIPTGNIVGIAVRRELVRKVDIDAVFKAIEIIAGQTTGTNPLRATDGAAYAMVTKKGTKISMFSFHFKYGLLLHYILAMLSILLIYLAVFVYTLILMANCNNWHLMEVNFMEDTHEPVISGITFMGYSQNWKTENPNNKQKIDHSSRQELEVKDQQLCSSNCHLLITFNVCVSNITKGHKHDSQNKLKYHQCLNVTIDLTGI